MNIDTIRLKDAATKIKGLELFGNLDNGTYTWTLRDKDGVVFQLAQNDQTTLNVAAYLMEAKPDLVLELIREKSAYQRMLVNTCAELGSIGEALGLDMDADAEEMRGAIKELLDGMNKIIAVTKLGEPAFGIATLVMGELGVRQDDPEDPDAITAIEWSCAERLADLPEVHEALKMFSEDPTGDAGTSLVRAVLEASTRSQSANQEAVNMLAASNKVLFDDLVVAAKQLRYYEEQHRAKGTEESTRKAEVNAELAARFEATIAQAGGSLEDQSPSPDHLALVADAERYRFVSDLAWYVEAGARTYNLCNINARWSDQRGSPDRDDVEEAIDKARLGNDEAPEE